MALTTKTIVFTDLADYTRNISQTEHQLLRRLVQMHEAHTEAIVAPHGGRLVRNLGDSFMVLFDSATRALYACMELVSSTLEVDENLKLRFRASAATGDIDLVGDYFIGEAINLSARINSQTPAGEAWFSDRTRMCMNHSEIPWESVGTFDFKGIPERVECFRAVAPGQCVLPEILQKAARTGLIHRVHASDARSEFAPLPDSHLILEGFDPGSDHLTQTLQQLATQFIPSRIWLQAASIPTAARRAWSDTGRGLVVGRPEALDAAIGQLQAKEEEKNTSTIFLDLSAHGDGRLELAGLALPAVPIAGMIQGYSFDLHSDGTWNYDGEGSLLRVDVGPEGVLLSIFSAEVLVNGVRMITGTQQALADGDTIEHPHGSVHFTKPSGHYAGILTGSAPHGMPLEAGTAIELGREPGDPGFVLPDRGGLDRLRWTPGPRSERARQAGLTLDRSMLGRRQLRIDSYEDSRFVATPIHDRIPCWIVRDGTLQRLTEPTPIAFGELLVMGAYVTHVVAPT